MENCLKDEPSNKRIVSMTYPASIYAKKFD